MPNARDWRRGKQRPAFGLTNRWMVMLIVVAASLVLAGVERWMRDNGAPIVGNASVADGDTLTISGIRIRLVDIDAPELDQTCTDSQGRDWPCGREALSTLRSYLRGRDITCRPKSKDTYGRTLATCTLPDKADINAWMVQQGFALSYGFGDPYRAQQAEARTAKHGIWRGTFTPPREWRRQHPRNSIDDRKD